MVSNYLLHFFFPLHAVIFCMFKTLRMYEQASKHAQSNLHLLDPQHLPDIRNQFLKVISSSDSGVWHRSWSLSPKAEMQITVI